MAGVFYLLPKKSLSIFSILLSCIIILFMSKRPVHLSKGESLMKGREICGIEASDEVCYATARLVEYWIHMHNIHNEVQEFSAVIACLRHLIAKLVIYP